MLVADISRFYQSIYTHTVPWATETKIWAKQNPRVPCAGNDFDRAIQRAQDGQTSGIPIGPDSSLLAGEIVASAVDRELIRLQPNVRGYRHVDDYQFVCQTLAEVDEWRAALASSLAAYELAPNDAKFDVLELPAPASELWSARLSRLRRAFRSTSAKAEASDLAAYFDTAFACAEEFPRSAVLSYALRALRSFRARSVNWGEYQSLLSQSMLGEPSTAANVLELLVAERAAGNAPDAALWGAAVHSLIEAHSRRRNHSEVAWALWFALVLGLPLDGKAQDELERIENSVCALLILDAGARGLFARPLHTAAWAPAMRPDGLHEDQWLLSYEANFKGWLPSAGGGDHVANHPVFGLLKRERVSFYDSNWYLANDPAGLTKPRSNIYP